MTVFWSLAAVMIMVALLFTLPPLFRSSRSAAGIDRDTLNVEVIRSQLTELDADLQSGRLNKDQYAASRRDLEQELLSDLGGTTTGGKTRGGQWAAILLVAGIPLLAMGVYNLIGSQQIIPLLAQMQANPPSRAQADAGAEGRPSVEEMVERLAQRLRTQPDDVKGWVMLARSYVVMKRYDEAVEAYRNILRLGGESPELYADYADALTMAQGGSFTPEAGELLQRALAEQPENIKALWLAGHWKNQSGEPAAALEYWQKAAALLPADGQDAAVIREQITGVREKLGLPPQEQAAPASVEASAPAAAPATPSAAAIRVEVNLDPQLAAQVQPDDTVFVFARALQGPRMPLAIVRKQASELPLSVTLDDSLAMSPAMVLSKFTEVSVGARISRSGNAMPQSGDLQGDQSPVAVGTDTSVAITIDQRVP